MNTPLQTYRATDRRVFQGAPCSDMQRERDRTDGLESRMKTAEPTATCTYFPMEGKYMTFFKPDPDGTWYEVTGNFHENKQEALIEAIRILENK